MRKIKSKTNHAASMQCNKLLERLDFMRLEANRKSKSYRNTKGQFFTSQKIAQLMARMFAERPSTLKILDPGAGIGSLSAALVVEACQWNPKPSAITITAYEIDPALTRYLHVTLSHCQEVCRQEGIRLEYEVIQDDFVRIAVEALNNGCKVDSPKSFNAAILNPPYKKINSASMTRNLLRMAGVETTNLYSAFLWLTVSLLEPDGELVAITPRSFCNGPYFLPFRKFLLKTMSINRIHVFDYRDRVFEDDGVLQETIILHAIKASQRERVTISSSADPNDPFVTIREVGYEHLVRHDDRDLFIHIVPDEIGYRIGQKVHCLLASLDELGIAVSTGKVVDFRVAHFLKESPDEETVPLIHPSHFSQGYIAWPNRKNRKPSAIRSTPETAGLLIPSGWYVLVKRFSAKEEKKRVVAAIYDPTRVDTRLIGVENHLNYYHQKGKGLPPLLAKGLAAFLNSTIVDEYFRQFSGHTQVNATDLRALKYPSLSQLVAIGEKIGDEFPEQDEIDQIILGILEMGNVNADVKAKKKIEEALDILRALRVPKTQLTRCSALTLLALVDMKPEANWSDATAPLRGMSEIMDFCRDHFGIACASNAHEAVLFAVRLLVQMRLVIASQDNTKRHVGSQNTKYQVDASLLQVIRAYGTKDWDRNLKTSQQ